MDGDATNQISLVKGGFADFYEVELDLPFRQRAAVVLRFYGRLSEKEIAEQLECAPGTVGSLIHRGVAALKEQLSNHEGARS